MYTQTPSTNIPEDSQLRHNVGTQLRALGQTLANVVQCTIFHSKREVKSIIVTDDDNTRPVLASTILPVRFPTVKLNEWYF